MELNDQKDEFGEAYVRAIAALAGFSADSPRLDRDSVDLELNSTGSNTLLRSPQLAIQIKWTVRATRIAKDGELKF